MPRGPLPAGNTRRRNAPTIPTTNLPVTGRRGRAPAIPTTYRLGKAGRAWWNWAWKLPQAVAWDAGALYVIARRAQLEDDLESLDEAEGLHLGDYMDLGDEDQEAAKRLETLIRKLKGLAGGRVSVMKEMRELDNRLGLTPKGLAELRWKIVEEEKDERSGSSSSKPKKNQGTRARARAVDPAEAAAA